MPRKKKVETQDIKVAVKGVKKPKEEKVKEPKLKQKFRNTWVGKTVRGLVNGFIIEAASLIPIKGHAISSKIEEQFDKNDGTLGSIEQGIETPVVVDKYKSISKIIGQVVVLAFILLYVFGKIAPEKMDFVFKNVTTLFGF